MDPGFAIIPNVFTPAETAEVAAHLATSPLARTRAGARHLLGDPTVAALASDARLLGLAGSVLGTSAIPYRATLLDKSPAANWLVGWHQDTALPLQARADVAGWGPWSDKHGVLYAHAPASALDRVIALRVHLDDSTADNGPLRVIPHSHREGVLTDEQVRVRAGDARYETCTVALGGLVAMRPLIIHASSKVRGAAPRRVIHIEYASSLHAGDGIDLRVV
jgi:ectoine hydroxylase-related dioxygenase (phytanoyl-CoA dioxygenase family)